MSENNNVNSGIGFWGLLLIIFIVCKLGGFGRIAEWSWVWVLAPFWIPSIIAIIIMIILLIIYCKNKY
jgi:hypothetical protein